MKPTQKLKEWLRTERRAVWLEYSVLSLIILLPLLLPGYILTLDLVFTPNIPWPSELTNTYPLQALLWLVHLVLPTDIIEKIILFLILLLSGVGMHLLLRRIKPDKAISGEAWQMAAYFAGVFYMINPFTYSRFMAGQWMVLLGYALLPFFFMALLRVIASPSLVSAVKLAVWAFVITTCSLHHIGMIALLAGVVLIMMCIKLRAKWDRLKKFLSYLGISALATLVLSSFWLVPALLGQGGIGQAVDRFDQTDFQAFATSGQGALGAIGDVIRLQGFWAEDRQLYLMPQGLLPLWGLVFLAIWIIVIIGVMKAWRHHRTVVILTLTCIGLGVTLAATPLLAWLSDIMPLASGYREPHKFVNLIALGYAVLGAFGVAYIIEWALNRFDEIGGQVATILCLLLPLAAAPTMLWGFAGQLSPRSYPTEWYEMNQTLKEKGGDKRVLFLPWHLYETYTFSGRTIANPAGKFFEVPMVISDDPEFEGVQPTVPNEEKRKIARALDQPDTLVQVLKESDISYILLAREEEEAEYDYLNKTPEIHLVSEDDKLKLYEVRQ